MGKHDIAYARLFRKPKQGLADKKNIDNSSDDAYDSELTFHGTPRKRKYPKTRKKREITKYKLKEEEKKLAQIKLLSYAPEFTNIYTKSHAVSPDRKFLYVDVVAVYDNRLYKITKLISYVMGVPFLVSHARFRTPDTVRLDYNKTLDEHHEKPYILLEEKLIKDLSMIMFGYDAGYLWHSMHELHSYDIIKPSIQKTYKAKKIKEVEIVDEEPTEENNQPSEKKTYRIK